MKPTSIIRPLDALWEARTLIWVVLAGEALALVLALAPGSNSHRMAYFGIASFAIQWVILMAMGVLFLFRSRIVLWQPVRIATLALCSVLLTTWLVCGLAWLALRDIWSPPGGGWTSLILQLTAISLTLGLIALASFRAHWHARQMAVRAKQAELEVLQARTHPHFLFNSLNTALALLHQRPDEAERVLLDLSDLFRSALTGPRLIPLAEELDLALRYLEIERLRLGERLDVRWELPSPLPALDVPALSVQPLVENAVRHGIEPRLEGGCIDVLLIRAGNQLKITVRNDLPRGPAVGTNKGHGVGQPSVAARIDAVTNGRGSLATYIEDNRYTATITIPVDSAPQVTTS